MNGQTFFPVAMGFLSRRLATTEDFLRGITTSRASLHRSDHLYSNRLSNLLVYFNLESTPGPSLDLTWVPILDSSPTPSLDRHRR